MERKKLPHSHKPHNHQTNKCYRIISTFRNCGSSGIPSHDRHSRKINVFRLSKKTLLNCDHWPKLHQNAKIIIELEILFFKTKYKIENF